MANDTMRELQHDFKGIILSLKTYIEAQKIAGISGFYLNPHAVDFSAGQKVLSKKDLLQELFQEVKGCSGCDLHVTRTNLVFGEGNADARLVFVGEAPGRDEDHQGRPFVGEAGQLLTRIIQAMKLKRDDVYICNVLKCRPPQNRNPLPTEVAACQEYLWRQLEIISPKIICCLGKFACSVLMGQNVSITKIRGKFQEVRGIKVMPTFHPAYLLRNASGKVFVWEDMQKIMAELKK